MVNMLGSMKPRAPSAYCRVSVPRHQLASRSGVALIW